MTTETKLPTRAGLSTTNGKNREITIRGDLLLSKANTSFPCGVSRVVVEGSVIGGPKHRLTIPGDLKVSGDVRCHNLRVDGLAEVAGSTTVSVLNVRAFSGGPVETRIVHAFNVNATEFSAQGGEVGFVTCEKLSYGKGLKFYRMVRNVSRYQGNDGRAEGEDVILPRR
jgi:hypothetical protein